MMKINFETQELINALTKASKAFPRNGAVRLELKKADDGQVVMSIIAYNEVDLQVHTMLGVKVEGFSETAFTVDGRKLTEAVNALRVLGSAVELHIRETDILVVCGDNHISLPLFGEPAKVLPKTDSVPSLILSLDGEVFSEGISKVAFATLDNQIGKDSDGVYLELAENGQILTASTASVCFGGTTAVPVKVEKVGEEVLEGEALVAALGGVTKHAFLPRAIINVAPYLAKKCFLFFFEKMLVIQSGYDGFFIGLKSAVFAKKVFVQVMAAVMDPQNIRLQVKKSALMNALKITAIGAEAGKELVPIVLTQNGKQLVLEDSNGQAKTSIITESDDTLSEERLFGGRNMLSCIAGAGEDIILSFPDGAMDGMAGISTLNDASTQVFIILVRRKKEE